MRIVLIGPPGSGKSTVGKALAQKLSMPFRDTDQMIESKQVKSVSDIFLENGEPFFRQIEFEVLQEVMLESMAVISLGGGAPISQWAQDLLLHSDSTIIFLDVSLSTAAPRVGFNRDRPLLLGNPRAQWQSLNEERRPIYEHLASHSIKVDAMDVAQIVSQIEKVIS